MFTQLMKFNIRITDCRQYRIQINSHDSFSFNIYGGFYLPAPDKGVMSISSR